MVLTTIQPAFAATEDELYNKYKETDTNLSKLGPLIEDAANGISAFNLSTTIQTEKEAYRSMIALEAWQKGFENPNGFNGVKENITAAANKLATTKATMDARTNPLTALSSASISNASSIGTTDPKNTFKFGDQEFILLKTEGQGADKMFYVMTKEPYGLARADASVLGRWDEVDERHVAYNLTNRLAMGRTNDPKISRTLPENILKHIDVMHIWDIEPNKTQKDNNQQGTKVIAPFNVISMNEYMQYASIIGKSEIGYRDWTRTPVAGNIQKHWTVLENTLQVVDYTSHNELRVRPVFYLKPSFFKEEKLQRCGQNVVASIYDIMTVADLSKYTEEEKKSVFEVSITPKFSTTDVKAGGTLNVSFEAPGKSLNPTALSVKWERSIDNVNWEEIPVETIAKYGSYKEDGTLNDRAYRLRRADIGYYVRAKMTPTYDMGLFSQGTEATSAAIGPIESADSLFVGTFTPAQLRAKFTERFTNFALSEEDDEYTLGQQSLMILKVCQEIFGQGFSGTVTLSASDYPALVTKIEAAAAELNTQIINTNPENLSTDLSNKYTSGYSSTTTIDAPVQTSPDHIFKIGGKEFIFLKSLEDGMVYVVAKDSYGTSTVDSGNKARWDDSNSQTLAYNLTNKMAFGDSPSSLQNLPSGILEHLDVMHIWDVEAGSRTGFTSHHAFIAPISLISVTEYAEEFYSIIGRDRPENAIWTRTPVKGEEADNASRYYGIEYNSSLEFKTVKKNSYGPGLVKPAFYLKDSFFKEEKLEAGGKNIVKYLDSILTQAELNALYTQDEINTIFGSYSVTPLPLKGELLVGDTLEASYEAGEVEPVNVDIKWYRSSDDKATWTQIPGAQGSTYTLTMDDNACFVKAVFTPTYESLVLRNGTPTIAETEGTIYQSVAERNAVNDVNTAIQQDNIADLRAHLTTHSALFLCEPAEAAFPAGAAQIFVNEPSVSSVRDVRNLYAHSIELYELEANAANDEIALDRIAKLLKDVPEYSGLDATQKASVDEVLRSAEVDKNQVKAFIERADEIIMLERFSTAVRDNIVSLIVEYAADLGVNITGLSDYKLQEVGKYLTGYDYGTEVNNLRESLIAAINLVGPVVDPSSPIEGSTGSRPIGGFIQPTPVKPEPIGGGAQSVFTDIGNVPWAETAINTLAQKGVLSGNGDGTFAPDRLLTRNEFVKMIVVAFDIERTGNELSYADIDNNSWSAEYIKAAVDAGIIFGVDDTNFGDGMNIIRQDVAVIAERILKHKGLELKSSSLKFEDSYEIADYALSAVAKVNYNGIMNGMSDTLFAPLGNTTRAQAAVVIYNLLNYYQSRTETSSGSEGDLDSQVNDKYSLVTNLGIIKDEFAKDPKVTRGELAAAIAVFGNYSINKHQGIFKDVAGSHMYAGQIEAVYDNNIMAPMTKDTFAPDEIATYQQAYDAILAAAGYKDVPDGAYKIDIALKKEPVFVGPEDPITVDMLKKMLYAALEVPVFDYKSPNTLLTSQKTILNINFNTYKEKGTINAVAGMAISGRKEVDEDSMIITVGTQDYIYKVDSVDYSDYLGYDVTYYYTEENGEYKIVNLIVSDQGDNRLKLSFEDIIDAPDEPGDLSFITYQTSSRTKTANIAANADFIYNGRTCYSITSADLIPNNGYITLIDTDRNNEYDVVKIENYEYVMVAQIDVAQKSILDRFTWRPRVFEEEDGVEKVNITKNGRYIRMDLISQGDILAIAQSRDGKLINVKVSDKKVSGSVVSKNSDQNQIQVGNTMLKTVKDFNFAGVNLGMNVTVGIDADGYAVGYYAESAGSEVLLGYVYKVVTDELTETKLVSMLTEDNEYVRYSTGTKLYNNGTVVPLSTLDAYNTAPQLIAYRLDADGNLRHIYPAVSATEAGHLKLNAQHISDGVEVLYNVFGMILGFDYTFLGSAKLFDITIDDSGAFDKENSRVTTISSKAIPESTELDDAKDKLLVYNADDSNVSPLCVYEHGISGGNSGSTENFNTQSFIINEIFDTYDQKSGEVVTGYKGYHSGDEVVYTMSKKLKDDLGTNIGKLKRGDVLLVWLSGTEITKFRRLFSFDETFKISVKSTDVMCNYGSHKSMYTSANPAVKSYEINDVGNSDGKPTGSRMATVYGDLLKIYKSENYTYPVISFRIAGSTSVSAFTIDSNTKIHVYNKRANTIRAIDSESLNFAEYEAVLTVRYGNVRDIVIYED